MYRSTLFRWIEEAEARSVREFAVVQRALSEPHVSMVHTRTGRPWYNWLRELTPRLASSSAPDKISYGGQEPDRVLVTLLITDIVESTKRVAEMGDRPWHALLDRHDNITRREIKRFRGRDVRNRGDGFLATFDSPARAVRCAAAIAEAIAPLGISLRSGLHTGEIQLTHDEISGIAVHIAARIAAIAQPGEALVSSTVRDLVAGSRLVFEDRGIHLLRGVPEEVHLYAMPGVRDATTASVITFRNQRLA
jgi:class 3 adenylate cyclase